MSSSNSRLPSLNTFLLTMICIATILSIRNWPLSVEYGLSSLVLIALAAITFLIPIALISAELSSKWPQTGGIYLWIKKAFGHKWGLAATWFVWISNAVWYPAVLSFIGAAATYSFSSEVAQNPKFLFVITNGIFWLITWINLRGLKIAGWFCSICLVMGTIIPAILLIGLSIAWIVAGQPLQMDISWHSIIPSFSGFTEIVFFAGLLLGFAGMEMPAVHANEVKNPQRNFPKAIYLATIVIVVFSLLGTFSLGAIVPKGEINLVTASLDAFSKALYHFGLSKFMPIVAFLITFGALGGLSSWIAGPSKSLLAAAKESNIPSILKKVNDKGIPQGILLFQASLVTLISLVFLVMPSISSSFWILTALASQLYLIAYSLMFIAAIRLRYLYPEVSGAYLVSRGNRGIWAVCSLGLLSSIFATGVGFLPPSQLDTGSVLFYTSFLVGGILLSLAVPFSFRQILEPAREVKSMQQS